jgi:hypothetical protein
MRGLLGIAAILFSSYACKPAESESRYLSLTTKGSVSTFYNRLALNENQLVLTNSPVESAIESQKLVSKAGYKYCFVEPQNKDAPKLDSEVGRFDSIRLILIADDDQDLHDVVGSHTSYVQCEASELTSVPEMHREANGVFLEGAAAQITSKIDLNLTVEPSYLEEKLQELSGKVTTTVNGNEVRILNRSSSSNKALARQWLKQEYEALGFTVTMIPYGSGTNFVAERTGADTSRFLAVSAHLDSVNNPGADDDGSGIVAGLAIAKSLEGLDLVHNIRFLGFDEEERGLVGSGKYARELSNNGSINQLVGLINIEMTGYDQDRDGAFHVIDCNENTSADLTTKIMLAHSRDNLGLQKNDACTNRSDHAAFWRYNKPAVVVSQNFFGGDSNPCYHRSCDNVDGMDFDYAARMTTLLARSVKAMVAQ